MELTEDLQLVELHMSPMPAVDELNRRTLDKWWQVPSVLPPAGHPVSRAEQRRNERIFEASRVKLFEGLRQLPAAGEKEIWRQGILKQLKEAEADLSHYENSLLGFFMERGYAGITDGFISRVREFDPELSVLDAFQAIRNVWIMCSIQILAGLEVRLTESVFAYSMLYPYSDNYLDDPSVPASDKLSFSRRFRDWITGIDTPARHPAEEKIRRLVGLIESQYDRERFGPVYEALLAIHSAQEKSLLQQKGRTMPYERDILGISFEKGGTSVLADGFLVLGDLSDAEARFMFEYGAFLQLIDDLQDALEDRENGHMTIFSQAGRRVLLDPLICKLLSFIDAFFHEQDCFNSEEARLLMSVIRDASLLMIHQAVFDHPRLVGRDLREQLESCSSLGSTYTKKAKRKFRKTFTSQDVITITRILAGGD